MPDVNLTFTSAFCLGILSKVQHREVESTQRFLLGIAKLEFGATEVTGICWAGHIRRGNYLENDFRKLLRK
jgi:hypothetical protein